MQQKILLVVHQKTSDTGRVGARIKARGYRLDIRCPMLGEALPDDMSGHAGAVVFGGPMSANDEHLPGIRAELDWLPSVLESETPYLGICLGAQLLARVLGAAVAPHPEGKAEIGYFSVRPTAAANGFLEQPLTVYHWHREGFDLPQGAVLLAEGACFPNQAYSYGAAAYGIQYHPEVTLEIMRRWLTMAAHRLVLPGAQPKAEQLAQQPRHGPPLGRWLDRFLGHWLGD